jgi:hypothetical protein
MNVCIAEEQDDNDDQQSCQQRAAEYALDQQSSDH